MAEAFINKRLIKMCSEEIYAGHWEVGFREFSDNHPDGTVTLTGAGQALAVFTMFFTALEEFIERYQPRHIEFSAEPARRKIYDRIMTRLNFQGYTYTRHQDTFFLIADDARRIQH